MDKMDKEVLRWDNMTNNQRLDEVVREHRKSNPDYDEDKIITVQLQYSKDSVRKLEAKGTAREKEQDLQLMYQREFIAFLEPKHTLYIAGQIKRQFDELNKEAYQLLHPGEWDSDKPDQFNQWQDRAELAINDIIEQHRDNSYLMQKVLTELKFFVTVYVQS